MPNNRSQFTQAPAYLTHNSITYQIADENWEAKSEIVSLALKTNLGGTVAQRELYVKTEIDIIPIPFKASIQALMDALIPYKKINGNRGSLLFPSTDLPVVIQTQDGRSVTYQAGAIMTPPKLQLAPSKRLFGSAKIICLRKADTAATSTSAHVADASSAFSAPSYDPANELDTSYVFAWGGALTGIECDEEGVTIEPNYSWQELPTWRHGLLNYTLDDVSFQLRFKPIGKTTAAAFDSATLNDTVLIQDGTGAGRGALLSARALAATLTGATSGDPLITVPLAAAISGSLAFGTDRRVGEVVMSCQPDWSATGNIITLATVSA